MNETNNNICSNCGSELEPNENYCNTCGTRVAANTASPVANGNAPGTSQYSAPTNYNVPPCKPDNYTLKACGITLLILVILSSLTAIMFFSEREKVRGTTCLSNVKQLGLAMLLYETDNNYMLPPADNWHYALSPYIGDSKIFDDKRTKHSYAMYEGLSNFNLKNMTESTQKYQVLAYSSPEGVTRGIGTDAVYPHRNTAPITYLDGHVAIISLNQK